MAERTRYLLAYDVREPRRLRRVHQIAKDFGHPLQYSVFVCDLTSVERIALRERLSGAINHGADSVGLFDLGPPRGRGVDCVEFLGVQRSIPRADEPAIW